jgi:hypothetical protein
VVADRTDVVSPIATICFPVIEGAASAGMAIRVGFIALEVHPENDPAQDSASDCVPAALSAPRARTQNGPSMTVRLSPERLTRAPCELDIVTIRNGPSRPTPAQASTLREKHYGLFTRRDEVYAVRVHRPYQ